LKEKANSGVRLINDLLFKIIFSSPKNEKLLICLLNVILNLENKKVIKSLKVLNPFSVREYLEEKESIVDIKAEDELGRKYNIEVQLLPQKSYINRILYYGSKLYSEQLKRSEPFEKINKVISISILDYVFFKEESSIHNIYKFINVESNKELTDMMEFHFIELPKYDENSSIENQSKFERWLHLLKFGKLYADGRKLPDLLKEEEGMTMVVDAIKSATADPNLKYILMSREQALLDKFNEEYERAEFKKNKAEFKKNKDEFENSKTELENSKTELENSKLELEKNKEKFEKNKDEFEMNKEKLKNEKAEFEKYKNTLELKEKRNKEKVEKIELEQKEIYEEFERQKKMNK
jgi:hypothetical protein